MNHTSEDHDWAKAARAGDPVARARYFFYDNWDIPNEFEKTVPQVFPTTAPGNFTYLEDCGQIVIPDAATAVSAALKGFLMIHTPPSPFHWFFSNISVKYEEKVLCR